MALVSTFRRRILLALALGVCAIILSRGLWLPLLGNALIRNDGVAKADIAVVLGGDYSGRRLLRAAELARQGLVPAVLVSGTSGFFGGYECDYAVAYGIRAGYKPELLIRFPHEAKSTREEAAVVVHELRRRGVRTALIVTSDFHTARSGRLFEAEIRRTGGGIAIRTVTAPDEFFHADSWWRTREGQKVIFFEWTKTITGRFGL